MKARSSLALAIGAAATLSLLQAAPADAGEIHNRKERQQDRIAQGVASGQLTPRETARLERREAHLNRETAAMRTANGGSLTPQERRLVNRQQNSISRGIKRQKHDGQTQ